jgi:hypothetical protein
VSLPRTGKPHLRWDLRNIAHRTAEKWVDDLRRFQLQDLLRAARAAGPVWEETSPLRVSGIAKLGELSQLEQSRGPLADRR